MRSAPLLLAFLVTACGGAQLDATYWDGELGVSLSGSRATGPVDDLDLTLTASGDDCEAPTGVTATIGNSAAIAPSVTLKSRCQLQFDFSAALPALDKSAERTTVVVRQGSSEIRATYLNLFAERALTASPSQPKFGAAASVTFSPATDSISVPLAVVKYDEAQNLFAGEHLLENATRAEATFSFTFPNALSFEHDASSDLRYAMTLMAGVEGCSGVKTCWASPYTAISGSFHLAAP